MQWLSRQSLWQLISLITIFSLVACGGKKSPTGPEQAFEGGEINTLTAVKIDDTDKLTTIDIQAQGTLSPNVFKLTDPLRVIVDFTDTQLGDLQSPIAVNNGVINEVTLTQFDDVTSSLSRIVIGFDTLVDYDVSPKESGLTITIPKGEGAVATEDTTAAEDPLASEDTLTDDLLPQDTLDVEAPADLQSVLDDIPIEEISEPSRLATKIDDIDLNVSGEQTQISLLANGSITDFNDFILENPKRLVVDLRGLQYRGRKNIPISDSLVAKVRTGVYPDKVRVVLDFASNTSPSYQINPGSSGLNILIGPSLADIDSSSFDSLDTPLPVTEEAAGEELVAIGDIPLDEIPVDESLVAKLEPEQPIQAEEPVLDIEEPFEELPGEPLVDEAPAVVPVATGAPYRVLSIDFVQAKGKSRIIVKTDAPASPSASDEGSDTVIINLDSASISRPATRFLDTSAFNSPVASIAPKQVGPSTRIVATLKEATPYTISQEGNFTYIDFERTKNFPGQDLPSAPEEVAAPVEAPEVELIEEPVLAEATPPAAPAETPEAPDAAPEVPSEDALVEDESIFDEQEEKEQPSYEYVKEQLLSESLDQESELGGFGDDMIFELGGSSKKYTGRKINLDFKDADIRSLFRLFADISKLNVIVGDDVSGKVTIRLRDVPWDQAFAILLQTQNLGALKYGNIIRVAPAEKIQKERELHAQAKKAAIAAAPLDTLFKSVSYAAPNELVAHVQNILSERGTVNVDTRTNTLIIRDVREKLLQTKALIEKLDTQTPQVTIEARIVEVSDTFVRNWGVQWGASAEFSPGTGNPTGLLFPNSISAVGSQSPTPVTGGSNPILLNFPPTGANSSVTLNLGSINNVLDLDLLLGYEESEGNAKLISSPKVTVLDNRPATILSGTRIPFITQTANAGNNVRFESAVISIAVTPHITADGSVIMNVNASRNEPDFGQQVLGNPTIIQREATTEVLVRSGNTTVIGGIYRVNRTRQQAGFPFLRKVPIVGWFFRADNRRLERQELLIFITPRIVGDERTVVRQVQG